ncbi:ComEA family DNA-binding protein [Rhodoflexus caldus]|uniref:ComEA family DNA-binding protein n=1 Tax=Rhodoflexus caldus TaxID=2891236 RepID=UPI002029DEE5|nr:helix-hairpin-helix domain-containing protein [Rhodoflexus caldus]
MKKTLLTALLLLLGWAASAQQKRFQSEVDLDQFIQSLFAVQDEDINYEDAYESLYLLYTNPLDLNRANYEQLADLYVLSQYQIRQFLDYRQRNGELLSIYELQAIEGFDLETIQKILPFVVVGESTFAADTRTLLQRILSEENNYLLIRHSRVLEEQRGFRPLGAGDTLRSGLPQIRYAGSPDKIYMRFRVSHLRDFSIGFTAEKDAGEPIAWNPSRRQFGMDFWSAHAAVYNRGRLKAIMLGDYLIQAGQGMLLAAGFTIGKGAETVATIRRSNTGIRPYTSVIENGFFRGAAATVNFGKVDVTPFISFARRSANVNFAAADTVSDVDIIGEAFINSIIPTGFHRTERELNGKNAIREVTGGITATYRSPDGNVEAGGTAMMTNFSVPIRPVDRIYNRFEFNGTQNHNIGGFFSYNYRNFNFFGEAARSASGGMGALAGFVSSLSAKVDMSMLYRRYDRNFHSFYGQSFSEGTRPINEYGTYWGIKIKPTLRWTIAAYYDIFRFPWLRFLVDAPSTGNEWLVRVTHQPNRKVAIYAQFRQETKGRNLRDNTTMMDVAVPSVRRNFQLNADFKAEQLVTTRSRIQWSSFQQEGGKMTQGLAIAQDIVLDFKLVKISSRFALFDTDDFENRQYIFEKDVLYSFSIPAYNGRGFRNYYMAQFNIGRKTDLWLRYAFTELRNQNVFGSGLDRIEGNRRSEFKVQLRRVF